MKNYEVKAGGKNDRVRIDAGRVILEDLKAGKTDTTVVPVRRIDRVVLNRRGMGADVVTLTAGPVELEMKMKEAEGFVAELLPLLGD